MSLINDMLNDLEARKAPTGQNPADVFHGQREESIRAHIDEFRHTDVTPRIEQAVRRRLPWLFWPFVLLLGLMAGGLYLFKSGKAPLDLMPSDTTASQSTPAPTAVQPEPAAKEALTAIVSQQKDAPPAAAVEPQLVMLQAETQGRNIRLDFAFNPPLSAAVRMARDGERVSLLMPGVHVEQQDAPHPALTDWQSGMTGADWQVAFHWPTDASVRLQPGKSADGLQHWQLTLAPAPASVPVPASSPVPGEGGRQPPAPATVSESRSAPTPASEPQAPVAPRRSPKPIMSMTPQQQAEALYAEAWQLQQKGSTDLAMDKLQQALQVQPEHARAHELQVRLLLRAGRSHEAELAMIRGLAVQPNQPDLVELYARLLADQGRVREAQGLLRERMQPERVAHQSLYAVLAARAGDHVQAAEAYARAAALSPNDPRWPLGQAVALENTGQPRLARSAYARALELDGLDTAARTFAQERLHQIDKGN